MIPTMIETTIAITFVAGQAHNTGSRGHFDPSISAKTGQSLMQAAQSANIKGIQADCGGMLTCGTCHVMLHEPWASEVPAPDAEELAMLEFTAIPCQPNSRLSCQITLSPALDGLHVQLPSTQY